MIDVKQFKLGFVGAQYRPAGEGIVHAMLDEHPVLLIREPQNPKDANAIAVYVQIGYVPANQAKWLAPEMDQHSVSRPGQRATLMDRKSIGLLMAVPPKIQADIETVPPGVVEES